MLHLDPSQQLVVDLFNPGIAQPVFIQGCWMKDDKLNYFSEQIQVPLFAGVPTQIALPVYYDTLVSFSIWSGIFPAGQGACFAHAYIRQGGVVNNFQIFSLCSGWITGASPISYPPVQRDDFDSSRKGTIARACTMLPIPNLNITPALGMPFRVIGFTGVFTADLNVANRRLGFGVDDGAGVVFESIWIPVDVTANQVITLSGNNSVSDCVVSNQNFTITLPKFIIHNPWRFVGLVENPQPGDAFTTCSIIIEPFVDL